MFTLFTFRVLKIMTTQIEQELLTEINNGVESGCAFISCAVLLILSELQLYSTKELRRSKATLNYTKVDNHLSDIVDWFNSNSFIDMFDYMTESMQVNYTRQDWCFAVKHFERINLLCMKLKGEFND